MKIRPPEMTRKDNRSPLEKTNPNHKQLREIGLLRGGGRFSLDQSQPISDQREPMYALPENISSEEIPLFNKMIDLSTVLSDSENRIQRKAFYDNTFHSKEAVDSINSKYGDFIKTVHGYEIL